MPINLAKPDARWETVGPELIMTSAEASHKAVIYIVDDDASLCFGLGGIIRNYWSGYAALSLGSRVLGL